MNILFYDTKTYDQASFTDTLKDFPNITMEFTKSDLDPRTAAGRGLRCRMRLRQLRCWYEDIGHSSCQGSASGAYAVRRL